MLIGKLYALASSFLGSKTVFTADANGDPVAQDLPIPDLPPTDYGAALIKMLLTLTALVVLLFFSYWFLRRLIQMKLQKGSSKQSIQIIEKRMISAKSMLYLVEVEGKKVLLAESHLEIRNLGHWSDADSAQPEEKD